MKLRRVTYLATALTCALCAPAVAQSPKDWIDIRNPQELRELFSNKTFKFSAGRVGHYRADGKGIFIEPGKQPQPRMWEIKGKDQVCFTRETGTTSVRLQRNRMTPNQLVMTDVNSAMLFWFHGGRRHPEVLGRMNNSIADQRWDRNEHSLAVVRTGNLIR
ncbi:MAG: hypothetical protein OEV81_13565 [Betaproteobacteria bacterium]|nr:hypothetical protein [Betaproteobacteria bacterium]MDH5221522.1 hypothetical protein [Betaproteobacteria bacterium]MDH5349467.1 hypothetical protein [Betaproteobacteria bacterium]